ncbi:MAG TPA: LCP family protein [Actinomycetes bacterium]|nr:LCP family protein [Actinomycetes bacterium]
MSESPTLTLPPELDPHGPGRGPGGPKRPGVGVGTVLAAVVSVMVLLVSGLGYVGIGHYLGKIHHQDVGVTVQHAAINDVAQNFLVVGSDNRAGLTRKQIDELHVGHATADNASGQRSDTMLLVHISATRNRVTVVSLPRDSLVTIPRWKDSSGHWHAASQNKLNAAFSFGGAPLAIKTIELATGITINHYVEVSFLGFVKMVDAVGTVTVCSPTAVSDKDSGLHLKKGENVLDSTEAMAYVRARHAFATQDLARIDHQQQFIAALFKAATQRQILLNPLKLNRFLGAALSSVTVDNHLSKADMLALATRLRSLAAGNLQFVTVPIANNNYDAPGLGSTVKWDAAKADLLFSRLRADKPVNPAKPKTVGSAGTKATVPPGQIQVQVLNGTTTSGLARSASNALAAVGFAMATPGNNSATNVTQTEIHYDPRYSQAVRTVEAALPGAKLVADSGRGASVLVVLGSDYKGVTRPVLSRATAPTSATPAQTIKTRTAADNVCS